MMDQSKDIYAILKIQNHHVMGKVDSVNDGHIVFKPLSDDGIRMCSFYHIDVFSGRRVYFKNLPVVTINEEKIKPEKFLFRTATRKINIRYLHTELTSIIERIIAV